MSGMCRSMTSGEHHPDSMMWIENGFWPSPSTQTGQAVLPHPAFQFMVLMDWLRHSTQGFGRVAPAAQACSPAHPAIAGRSTVSSPSYPKPRCSGAAKRKASRHYSAPCEMGFPRRPTPLPCPPSLHGRYPLLRYYEDSDPDWPFPHQPWFPDLRHLNFQTFHLQPSAVLDQTRSTPSALAALFRSGFAVSVAGSPKPPTESSSPVSVYRDVLRIARSVPVAFHPGVSPRRSYFQLLALK